MPEYMTIGEVADLLRVSERSVYEWLRVGKLRGVRAGWKWRVTADAVEEYLARDPHPGAAARALPPVASTAAASPPPDAGLSGSPSPAPGVAALPVASGPGTAPPPAARPNVNPLAAAKGNKARRGRR